MLIISGIFEIDPDDHDAAVAAATAMALATREEVGCRSYAFYADIEAPDRFRVFEEWHDEAALQAHFQSPHMATFRTALGGISIRSRSIWRYEVAAKAEL